MLLELHGTLVIVILLSKLWMNGMLSIIYDHVLEKDVEGFNTAKTIRNEAVFYPERGAYSIPLKV